ncbi:hypothetical protein Tco_0085641 [Tanacetum coccineum]
MLGRKATKTSKPNVQKLSSTSRRIMQLLVSEKKVDTLKATLEENQVEYERLVLEDKRWVGYKDKLVAFEAKCEGLKKDGSKLGEVEIKLREKIPAYCVTNQREYDDLGNEFKNAMFPFPTEANSNPSAPLEALPSKKPMEYGDVGLSYSHVTTWS